MKKFAIEVPISQRKYIYIKDINGDLTKPVLFDDEKVAKEKSVAFGPKARVVEYED